MNDLSVADQLFEFEDVNFDEDSSQERYLLQIATGFFKSKILSIGIQKNFFSFLSDDLKTFQEIQDYLGFSERPSKIFLEALIDMKLITLHGSKRKYGNTPISQSFLQKKSITYVGNIIKFFDAFYDDCSHLVKSFESDQPIKDTYSYFFENKGSDVDTYSNEMQDTSDDIAVALINLYDFDENDVVLDIGGGTGNFCINLVSQLPETKAILFDLPAVCEKAKARLADFWLSNRIDVHPGDFFNDTFPSGFNTALLMRIAHDWSTSQLRTILKRIYDGLPQGGRLIICETFKNDDLNQPNDALIASLILMIISPHGECRSINEMTKILQEVGFRVDEVLDVVIIYQAIVAIKE